MKDLSGKVVVITGGGRGIGRATAVEFLKSGARVVIADIDQAVAEQTAIELSAMGEIWAYRLDVTKRPDFDALIEKVERERGPVDVLVNNAGIMSLGKFMEHEDSAERKQIEINLFGVMNGMRAVIPRMQERGRGHIVNIASLAGRVGIPNATAYSASKFAVIGATEAVRNELYNAGIDFTYVMPYLVNTDLVSGTRALQWPPIVEPEDVATALVDAVKKRKLEVYVPKIGQLSAMLPVLLPRTLTDWIGKKMGLNKLFGKVDSEKRAAYVARTTAPGALESKDAGPEKTEKGEKPKVRAVN